MNVLYVSIPEAMSGGRLEMYRYSWLRVALFPYLLSFFSIPQLDRILPPDASVEPSENLLVSFRGDTIHRVGGYNIGNGEQGGAAGEGPQSGDGNRNGLRVSVVLEQYSVPIISYKFTTSYNLSAGSIHNKPAYS